MPDIMVRTIDSGRNRGDGHSVSCVFSHVMAGYDVKAYKTNEREFGK